MERDPPPSALLALYLALSRRGGGVAARVLARRALAGKEDRARLGERMGAPGLPRPEGRLAWFHAASVGEAVSLLELLRRIGMERPDLTCLVTTGTVTSAEMMAARLPTTCLHQYAPLDVAPWVERFLDHWRPDLAVWTESDLWPATIVAAHRRGAPMALINARISHRSFGAGAGRAGWRGRCWRGSSGSSARTRWRPITSSGWAPIPSGSR